MFMASVHLVNAANRPLNRCAQSAQELSTPSPPDESRYGLAYSPERLLLPAQTNDWPPPADGREQYADVAIVGAGPVGLTLANFLGLYGVSALVIERGL